MVHKSIDIFHLNSYKLIFIFMLIIIGLIYIFSSMSITLNIDEPFTMGLVQHNFGKIISLDSLDVHPPLYYLLLKSFLIIPSYFTKSMAIQILFARVFSFIIYLLIIYVAIKVLKYIDIKINYKMQRAILFTLPVILSKVSYIRMYSLSVLLILCEIYELVKFNKNKKYKFLFYSLIFVVLNFYTFYIGAMSSEIYLLLNTLYIIKNDKKVSYILLVMSNFIPVLLFIPWVPILLKQYAYHVNNDNPIDINIIHELLISITQSWGKISVLLFVSFIGFMAYSIRHDVNGIKFNKLLLRIFIDLLITLFFTMLVCKHDFQPNTIYPISATYIIFVSAIVTKLLSNYHKKIIYVVGIFIILLAFIDMKGTASNINNIPNEIHQISMMRNWKLNNSKDIRIWPHNYIGLSGKAFDAAQDSLYLSSIKKNSIIQHESYKSMAKGILNNNHGSKLINKTFTNMYVNH